MRCTLLILTTLISATTSLFAESDIPKPSHAQMVWQEAELTVVFHYDLHVCDGQRYNQAYNRTTPITDINMFNPTDLDTDQWIKSAKDMGAKIAILTATHETGFALYQSDVNPYCMKALKFQDGKGDIVRDFVNSCRKYGVKPGIYIGIRWNSFMGVYDFMMPNDGSKFQENRQLHFNKMCEGMTEELMSRYGDLAIVWYDGGGHGPELGGADILPIVEKYQKDIIFYHNSQRADIRWGGSESGMVPYPCWATFPFKHINGKIETSIYANDFNMLKVGNPNGTYYSPAMSDAPLRGYNGHHDWFWEPDSDKGIFPLDYLMKIYYNSVGHNSSLILGLTPNDKGLLPDADVKRLKEFGDEIKSRFNNVTAETSSDQKVTTLKLNKSNPISNIVIQEEIEDGERVRAYCLEVKVGGKWQLVENGSCIGHKRIIQVDSLPATSLRLTINESVGDAKIKRLATY